MTRIELRTLLRASATTLVAFALGLALGGSAAAQDTPRGGSAPAPDVSFDFADHRVDGDYRRPLGEVLDVRRRGSRQTLVRPRLHFVPELVSSAENI